MKKARLTEQQKAWRRRQARADRENAKISAEIPLFADQVPQATAEGEFWRWRKNVSEGVERGHFINGSHLLSEFITIQSITRYAAEVLGPERFAKLDAHCRHMLRSASYWYEFWRGVLTGKRIDFAWKRVENRKPGEPAVICADWHQHEYMTTQEFYERWPYSHPEPEPAPDDRGLAALLDQVLARHRKGLP